MYIYQASTDTFVFILLVIVASLNYTIKAYWCSFFILCVVRFMCGRVSAPRVCACARVLRGACRYCSSTEWFVSYNGGAGRTVLRQERQDGRALQIKRVRETWRKGKVDKNNSNETTCGCKSPELGRVAAWL